MTESQLGELTKTISQRKDSGDLLKRGDIYIHFNRPTKLPDGTLTQTKAIESLALKGNAKPISENGNILQLTFELNYIPNNTPRTDPKEPIQGSDIQNQTVWALLPDGRYFASEGKRAPTEHGSIIFTDWAEMTPELIEVASTQKSAILAAIRKRQNQPLSIAANHLGETNFSLR